MALEVKRSSGPFDALRMMRESTDGSLTTTGTYNGIDLSETPVGGIVIRAVVPSAVATTTLDLIIQAAGTDAEASYVEVARFEQITAAGEYITRLTTQRRYARISVEVAGTTPDFGEVEIGPTMGGF